MGGFNYGRINGQPVEYGDLCEIEVCWGAELLKILCTFVETTDDGDHWFKCIREEDCVRGDSYFPDYYQEVGNIRVIGKETPEMFCAEGI